MMKQLFFVCMTVMSFTYNGLVHASFKPSRVSQKASRTFLRKHTRELLALAAGAAIASGATAYGMKKKEARTIATLQAGHAEALQQAQQNYVLGMTKNQEFFQEQLNDIKRTLEETIQRTVTVALETFKNSLDFFQERITEMLRQQHQDLRQGIDDFKSAGREQYELWQQQFDALGERFSIMFDGHATKMVAEYGQLQQELLRKERMAQARDEAHKEHIQAQFTEQREILQSSLREALQTLDAHKSQMTDLVAQSQELLTHATEVQRQELLRGLQEIGAAGQRFEISQTQGMANIYALLNQHSQQLLGTIDTGMAQGFMQQNQAITDGLVTGFNIQQQQVGQLVAGRGGMRQGPISVLSAPRVAPLLLEDAPAVNPFSPEAQGTVQGPVSPRSQEELEALDPAPSQRQQSGPGSVRSGRSSVSQSSFAPITESKAGEYVLSSAAQKRIAAGKVLRQPEVQRGMRRAQEILARPEFQPRSQGPAQMRTGQSGVRADGRRIMQQAGVMVL